MNIKAIDRWLFPALTGKKPSGQSPRDYVRAESKKRNMTDSTDSAVKCYDDIISQYCDNKDFSPSFADGTMPDREVPDIFYKDNGMFYDKEPIHFDYFKYLAMQTKEKKTLTELSWGYNKRRSALRSSVYTVREGTGFRWLKDSLQYLGLALIAALVTFICYVLMDIGILVLIAWSAFFVAAAATLFFLGASFFSLFANVATNDDKARLKKDFLSALRFVRFRALWYQQMSGEDAVPSYLISAEKDIYDLVKPVKRFLRKRLYMKIRYEEDVEEKQSNLAYSYDNYEYKFTVSISEAKKAIEKADAAREASDYATAARNYLKACNAGYDDFFADAWSMVWEINDDKDDEKRDILNEVMRYYDRTHRNDISNEDTLKMIYQYLSYGYQKDLEKEIGGTLVLYDPAYAMLYKTKLRPTVEKAGFYARKLADMGDTEHLGLAAKAIVLLAENSRELKEALEWLKKLESSDDADNIEMIDELKVVIEKAIDKVPKNEDDANYVSAIKAAAEMGIDTGKCYLAIYYYNHGDYNNAYKWIDKTIMPFRSGGTSAQENEKWFDEVKRKITTAYRNKQ